VTYIGKKVFFLIALILLIVSAACGPATPTAEDAADSSRPDIGDPEDGEDLGLSADSSLSEEDTDDELQRSVIAGRISSEDSAICQSVEAARLYVC